jgi:hypothetical protein
MVRPCEEGHGSCSRCWDHAGGAAQCRSGWVGPDSVDDRPALPYARPLAMRFFYKINSAASGNVPDYSRN